MPDPLAILRRLFVRTVRLAGRAQFRSPRLRALILRAARPLLRGVHTIRFGVGRGLRFAASGTNPGYVLGTSDPEEQRALARLLRPGDTFWDVGANAGFFTVIGARLVEPAGRVVAFEPYPPYADLIRENAARNGFAHVEVRAEAVSDVVEARRLYLERPGADAPAGPEAWTDVPYVDVTTVRLDDLVSSGAVPPPDLVKLDVEGFEIRVLDGMRETLDAHRPVILCEVHWLGDAFRTAAADLAARHGYHVSRLEGGPLPDGAGRYHALFLPPDRT